MKKEEVDKISVIIPVYNVELYLEECLESVCNQTYSNLQIIVVDDGSTDSSGMICDKYAEIDQRVEVVHKKNGGLSDARNWGLDLAKGEWITCVDSDDILRKDAIEILYYLAKKENVKLVLGSFYNFKGQPVEKEKGEMRISICMKQEALKNVIDIAPGNWIAACGKLYHRSLFDGIRYPKGKIYEDTYVIHLLYDKVKKIVRTEEEIYFYRLRDDSIMGTYGFKKRVDLYTAYLERLDYLKRNKYSELYEYQKDVLEWILHKDFVGEKDKKEKKILCSIYRKFYVKNFWTFQWKYKIIGFINCIVRKC